MIAVTRRPASSDGGFQGTVARAALGFPPIFADSKPWLFTWGSADSKRGRLTSSMTEKTETKPEWLQSASHVRPGIP